MRWVTLNQTISSVESLRGVSPPIQGSFVGDYVFLGRCPRLRKARLVEAEEGYPAGVFRIQRDSFQWLDSMQCGTGALRPQGAWQARKALQSTRLHLRLRHDPLHMLSCDIDHFVTLLRWAFPRGNILRSDSILKNVHWLHAFDL